MDSFRSWLLLLRPSEHVFRSLVLIEAVAQWKMDDWWIKWKFCSAMTHQQLEGQCSEHSWEVMGYHSDGKDQQLQGHLYVRLSHNEFPYKSKAQRGLDQRDHLSTMALFSTQSEHRDSTSPLTAPSPFPFSLPLPWQPFVLLPWTEEEIVLQTLDIDRNTHIMLSCVF